MGFGNLGILTNSKLRALDTNLHEMNFSKLTAHPPTHPGWGFSIFKFDFSPFLCYNIYIEDTTTCGLGVIKSHKRSLNYTMPVNRLKLDFSIQTTDGRRDFVNEYVT